MKKNPEGQWSYAPPYFTKLLKIMRLTTFFLVVTALSVKAGGFSQNTPVSITLNTVKLTTFFKVVENETGYRFAYSNDILPTGKIVTISAKKRQLSEVMNEVMASTNLKYRFDEKSGLIIISE
ncbi:MAG TPA: hypothetical protein PK110_15960, partial [Niabella sp.]|nr:hypothetical protein [Niabella sp.]